MDDHQAGGVDGVGFFGDEVGGFVEDVAALGVAGEAEADAEILEHGDADFAGESAAGFAVGVLGTEKDFGTGDGAGDGVDVDEGRGDGDVDVVGEGAGDGPGQVD